LITYGKEIINKNRNDSAWNDLAVSPLEYQEALITMWQTQAKLIAGMADLQNAVNLGIYEVEAQKKVILAKEALKQAKVALAQAKQRLDDTSVYAPSDGQVQEVYVREGQIISSGITTVTGGTPLMTLADVKKLYVVAEVDEADIGRVRELAPVERSGKIMNHIASIFNQPTTTPATAPVLTKENEEEMAILRGANNVDVTVDAFREDNFIGKVDRVYPNSKNINNIVTYNVRILLSGANSTKLMLGMHANVKFTSRKLANVLLVENEAIKSKNEQHGVYIKGSDDKPKFIPVKVGLTDSAMIELKTNELKEGQEVYTKLPATKEEGPREDE
jgi:HlyD family secretion protein